MACMEHTCSNMNCPNAVFNNMAHSPSTCSKCGSPMQHFFDEEPDEPEERDEDPDYD